MTALDEVLPILTVFSFDLDNLAYRGWQPGARVRTGFCGNSRKKLLPIDQLCIDADKAMGTDGYEVKFDPRPRKA